MYLRYVFLFPFLMTLIGCTNQPSVDHHQDTTSVREQVSIKDWNQMEMKAIGREGILNQIQYYQSVSGNDDRERAALTRTTSLYLLLGAEYAESKSEQRKYYRHAANTAEKALQLDGTFQSKQLNGSSIPEAAEHLTADYFEPLFLWATSIFYHFRDVASVPERILFNSRLKQAAEAIEVIIRKDPAWFDGSLQFTLGIYYLSVPEAIGGDREKAMQLMEDAVAMSNKRLLTRWGRAKYLAVATDDKQLFLQDLRWVVQQDINEMDGPAIWNRYFQEDARRLLDEVEELF